MKRNGFYFALMVLFLITHASCSEEEEEPLPVDPREAIVGNYDGNLTVTQMSDLNNTQTSTTNFEIKKASIDDQLLFVFDGSTYTLEDVSAANNGTAFRFKQTAEADTDGDMYDIIGNGGTTNANNETFDGRYDTGSKQLFLNLRTDYQNNDYDECCNFKLEFSGIKQ